MNTFLYSAMTRSVPKLYQAVPALLKVVLIWCLAPFHRCRVTSASFPSVWLWVFPPRTVRNSRLPGCPHFSAYHDATKGWILSHGQSHHLIHHRIQAPHGYPQAKLNTKPLELPSPSYCVPATDPSCQTHRLNVNRLSVIDINTGNTPPRPLESPAPSHPTAVLSATHSQIPGTLNGPSTAENNTGDGWKPK